ncbi:hypothetical protein Bhyg_03090 [Pseudolycoriella hygida]|uniref:Uncharacterized protein n=1 Tax=Pseudolycoriella hygida TaxID=35572 RepID=A0A9Q0NCM6_9DIPT|nr:hypothetical protein Bhyg_03090 [Pseudolycoriella hygida]
MSHSIIANISSTQMKLSNQRFLLSAY